MRARLAGSFFAGLWLLGCGSKESSGTEAEQSMRCAPGAVYSCVRWNCSGHQRCADDGAMLGPCTCDGDAADGGGGRSGAGGAGGSQTSLAKASSANGGSVAKRVDAGDRPQDAGQSQGPSKPDKPDASVPSTPDAGAPAKPDKPDAGKPDTKMDAMPQTMMPSQPEQCDNGLDDDGDGKVDCADSDCGALRCVAAAPSGWSGPVVLHLGAMPAAFSCAGVFDQRVFEAGAEAQAAPAQCSACTCQGSCGTFVDFSVSAGAECGAASACTTSVNGGCAEIAPQCLQMATVASLETRLPNASSCTSSEQHAALASPSWKTQVAACGLPAAGSGAGGCEAEQLCLPQAPGMGLQAGYCVWREGEVDCPAATYTERSVYYREFQDTRSCSACGCAASSCKYSWRVYNADDAMCTSPVLELSSAGQCAQVNPVMGKLRVGGAVSGDGSCTSSGGESRGAVVGAKALTVCCAI